MRNEIKSILKRLKEIEIKVQGSLDNAEGQGEREESLENELNSMQEAIEALENIE